MDDAGTYLAQGQHDSGHNGSREALAEARLVEDLLQGLHGSQMEDDGLAQNGQVHCTVGQTPAPHAHRCTSQVIKDVRVWHLRPSFTVAVLSFPYFLCAIGVGGVVHGL